MTGRSASATDPIAKHSADLELLAQLRSHRRLHRAKKPIVHANHRVEDLTPPNFGQRLADRVAQLVGSWTFILIQSGIICIWIAANSLAGKPWDPYPFILLNLVLSFQAAYTAPAIMMSQNRLSEIDRQHAENDYEVNVKAELEIELLHQKIDLLKEKEILLLTETVKAMSGKIDAVLANR